MYTTEGTPENTSNTSDNTPWFEYESSLSKIVENYITLPLFFVAVIGNSLIVIVFSRHYYRHNLIAMLYRILAVSDGLVVIIQDGMHTLPFVTSGKSAYTYNRITCKSAIFLSTWFRTFSVWIIIALTLEKFVSVCWPYQASVVNTKRNYGWIVFAMLLISCILYVPLLITTGHEHTIQNGKLIGICRLSGDRWIDWYLGSFIWMNVLVSSFLPFLFVAIANTVIIVSLRNALIATPTMTGHSSHVRDSDDRLKSNIIILLSISMTSVIFTLPDPLYLLLSRYYNDPTSASFHRLITLRYILPLFDAVNRSINILLFCVFGRNFRQHLKELLLCTGWKYWGRYCETYKLTMRGHAAAHWHFKCREMSSAILNDIIWSTKNHGQINTLRKESITLHYALYVTMALHQRAIKHASQGLNGPNPGLAKQLWLWRSLCCPH